MTKRCAAGECERQTLRDEVTVLRVLLRKAKPVIEWAVEEGDKRGAATTLEREWLRQANQVLGIQT